MEYLLFLFFLTCCTAFKRFVPSVPGVTCSTVGVRRKPNAFNIVWQLELLVRSGVSQQNAITSLEAFAYFLHMFARKIGKRTFIGERTIPNPFLCNFSSHCHENLWLLVRPTKVLPKWHPCTLLESKKVQRRWRSFTKCQRWPKRRSLSW